MEIGRYKGFQIWRDNLGRYHWQHGDSRGPFRRLSHVYADIDDWHVDSPARAVLDRQSGTQSRDPSIGD